MARSARPAQYRRPVLRRFDWRHRVHRHRRFGTTAAHHAIDEGDREIAAGLDVAHTGRRSGSQRRAELPVAIRERQRLAGAVAHRRAGLVGRASHLDVLDHQAVVRVLVGLALELLGRDADRHGLADAALRYGLDGQFRANERQLVVGAARSAAGGERKCRHGGGTEGAKARKLQNRHRRFLPMLSVRTGTREIRRRF